MQLFFIKNPQNSHCEVSNQVDMASGGMQTDLTRSTVFPADHKSLLNLTTGSLIWGHSAQMPWNHDV